MAIDRREFLGWAAVTVAAGCAEDHRCTGDEPIFEEVASARAESLALDPFTLGVASGDPLEDRVMLWTRLAPAPLDGGGMPDTEVRVGWQVARDEAFEDVVSQGVAIARPEHAHAVHVDAVGLDADRWYYYRFFVGDHTSPTGRTRTFPCVDDEPESVRFAVASCQKYRDGYFTAHRHLAGESVDFVLFLGDYIYESAGSTVRDEPEYEETEAVDLESYRHRYAFYKRDPDLRAAHYAAPWIAIWDDHEVDNDYAGLIAGGEDVPTPAFEARRTAAYQAYWEHMPVRVAAPTGPTLDLYRSAVFGDLFELFVIDTRQYRDDQVCSDEDFAPVCDERDAPSRTMLGETQETWLFDGLKRSSRRWKLIGNQIVMATLDFGGTVANFDIWDGYTAARQRLLDVIRDVDDVVVLTGDLHAAGVADLNAFADRPGASRVIAPEFVVTSISSGGDDTSLDIGDLVSSERHIHYVNAGVRGYMVCSLDRERLRVDLRFVEAVETPDADIRTEASFAVVRGDPSPERIG